MNRRKRQQSAVPPAWRVKVLLGAFVFAAVALEGRLVWLQLVEGEFLTAEGRDRQLRDVPIPAHRGLITDRYGEPLAVSTPVDSVFVDPQQFPADIESIYALARATGRDGDELVREITSRLDRRFHWVERGLSPAHAARVLEMGFPGVGIRREYKRFSPTHEVACHLVGITNIDDAGIEGLELVFDHLLAGTPGLKRVQQDERGREIGDIEQIRPARPGRDLRTSIDLRLQYPAYFELKKAALESGADSASLVMLDVVTGEVLAMVNQPSCNPNDETQRQELSRFRNRAIIDPIEPGSTIKPLVLAAALASGYTPETPIDVPKDLKINGRIVTSDENRLGGVMTVTEILALSSSVGMGTIALDLDPALMWRTLRSFGIAGPTESGLGSHESHGILEDYALWCEVCKATLSYGYGLQATPLQIARAYAAIANGGLLPPVSFEALDAPPEHVQAIAPEIAAELMAMLEVVVSDQGTALRAAIPGYSVAGKTGTVRIHDAGGYSDTRKRAFFAGMAPASAPRFVAVVVINDPRGAQYYGGDIAAPVFAAVVGKALRMYGVAPDALPEQGSVLISRAAVE